MTASELESSDKVLKQFLRERVCFRNSVWSEYFQYTFGRQFLNKYEHALVQYKYILSSIFTVHRFIRGESFSHGINRDKVLSDQLTGIIGIEYVSIV